MPVPTGSLDAILAQAHENLVSNQSRRFAKWQFDVNRLSCGEMFRLFWRTESLELSIECLIVGGLECVVEVGVLSDGVLGVCVQDQRTAGFGFSLPTGLAGVSPGEQ